MLAVGDKPVDQDALGPSDYGASMRSSSSAAARRRGASRGAGAAPTPRLDDRFDPRVAVRAVAWSPNLGRGLLLASGTAVGLVRVEWAEAGDDAPPAS